MFGERGRKRKRKGDPYTWKEKEKEEQNCHGNEEHCEYDKLVQTLRDSVTYRSVGLKGKQMRWKTTAADL